VLRGPHRPQGSIAKHGRLAEPTWASGLAVGAEEGASRALRPSKPPPPPSPCWACEAPAPTRARPGAWLRTIAWPEARLGSAHGLAAKCEGLGAKLGKGFHVSLPSGPKRSKGLGPIGPACTGRGWAFKGKIHASGGRSAQKTATLAAAQRFPCCAHGRRAISMLRPVRSTSTECGLVLRLDSQEVHRQDRRKNIFEGCLSIEKKDVFKRKVVVRENPEIDEFPLAKAVVSATHS